MLSPVPIESLFYQQVKNELPSTFKAFRYQQHRWSCGPANLFRKMFSEIVRTKVSFSKTFSHKLCVCLAIEHYIELFFLVFPCYFLQKVSFWKKVYVIYSFFMVRKITAHIVTFVFYCIVLPATVLVPEVEVPKWGSVYIPAIITVLNAAGTPRFVSL